MAPRHRPSPPPMAALLLLLLAAACAVEAGEGGAVGDGVASADGAAATLREATANTRASLAALGVRPSPPAPPGAAPAPAGPPAASAAAAPGPAGPPDASAAAVRAALAGFGQGPGGAASAAAAPPGPAGPPASAAQLLGLPPERVRLLLGEPELRRPEGTAEVWLYTAGSCALDVILYQDRGGRGLRVAHAAARVAGADRQTEAACLRAIAAASGGGGGGGPGPGAAAAPPARAAG